MPAIKPVSDLRNYNEVLKNCVDGSPVFLTKNGHGRYVLLDMEEYEKQQTMLQLFGQLTEAEESVKKSGWKTAQDLQTALDG